MIMEKPHVKYGSKHYFQAVCLFRDVLKDHETLYDVKNSKGEWIKLTLWGIAKKTLSRNGFFAMYEPILLARMLDDDREIRKAAFKEIKAAMKYEADRKKRNPDCVPRRFEVFQDLINFDAQHWTQLLDTSSKKFKPRHRTVPPLLSMFTIEEMEDSIQNGPLSLPDIPCHSQHVSTKIAICSQNCIQICRGRNWKKIFRI